MVKYTAHHCHAAIAILALAAVRVVSPALAEERRAGSVYIQGNIDVMSLSAWKDTVVSDVIQFPGNPVTTQLRAESRTATRFGAGLGFYVTDYFRVEASSGYWRREIAILFANAAVSGRVTAPVQNVATYFSAYLDIPTALAWDWRPFTPYVGGGVGFAWTRIPYGNVAQSDGSILTAGSRENVSFAWKAAAGTEIALLSNVSLDVGYAYLDLGRFRFPKTLSFPQAGLDIILVDPLQARMRAHAATIGLRIRFGP